MFLGMIDGLMYIGRLMLIEIIQLVPERLILLLTTVVLIDIVSLLNSFVFLNLG